jgi:transcription antitermination factor NusG
MEKELPRYWRVFYTAPRAEKKCRDRLKDQNIDVFLPTRKVQRDWSDRTQTVIEPLFRSYIFANVNERERLTVLRTNGIVRCVSFDGKIARVRSEVIEQLREYQKHPETLEVLDRPRPGTEVTITEGPMKGMEGEVIEHRGKQRLVLRIDAIRQAVSVEISSDWIETTGE